jgi:hypothetical protein
MNFSINRILSLAIGVALLGGAAVSASAAEFYLPFEAKWGGVVLAPGNYQVTLPERSLGKTTFLVRGETSASFIQPMSGSDFGVYPQPASGPYLQLVKVDGEYFVKKYEAGWGGLTFFFKTPKPIHREKITAQQFSNIAVSGN